MLSVLLWSALVAAPAPKLAMTPLRGGDGTTAGMTEMVGESVAAEIRRKKTFQVLTYGELKTVLSHEQLNQLVGCNDAGCFANIGQAAGAEALATGKLGKVGKSWIITLKIIDVRAVRVLATADRRIRDGTIDDVLDQLPGMVSELVEGAADRLGRAESEVVPAAVTAVSATSSKHPIPKAYADEPLQKKPEKLEIVSDGAGHLIAFEPDERSRGELFAGDAEGLYLQRKRGSSANGPKWSIYVWEPRCAHATFLFTGDGYLLKCDERKIEYKPVRAKQPPLFEPRWRRSPVVLARDDKGNYYYVDKARGGKDYRLFVGTRGRVEFQPLRDAIVDAGSSIFISDLGRLIVEHKGRDEEDVAWAVGDSQKPLTAMSLWSQSEMVYTSLGVYTGQPVGTVCDPYVGEAR